MNILDAINKALSFVKLGKIAQAEKIYLELLAHHPDDIRVLPFLGWLYFSSGRYKDAVDVFEKVNHSTRDINVITGLGLAYYYLNQYKAAYDNLRIAADEKPSLDVLEKLITCACEKTNKPETVFGYAKKMRELYPDSPKTWEAYILAALCAGHLEEAENYCAEKLTEHPESPALYISAGLVQEVLYSNYKLALECYIKSYELNPSMPALYNMGLMYSALKDYDKAEECLLKASADNPDSPSLNTTLYLLYAKKKEFNKAYDYLQKAALKYGRGAELVNHWHGETSINETLYVYGDQGIGDIIMYSRYLPFLKENFKKVILALPQTLIPLFKENFSSAFYQIVSLDEPVKYDKSTFISFLPYYLNMDFYKEIPSSDGYLKINNPENNLFNKDKLNVGIVWEAGGTGLRGPLDRTMNPRFLAPLFEGLDNVNFYSLQVNAAMKACDMYPALTDIGSGIQNFLQTADAVNNLDAVISIDTSVAHLAGAMGKKVFILLPYVADWRWFDSDGKTAWYTNAELFRQTVPGDWGPLISEVKERIKALASAR